MMMSSMFCQCTRSADLDLLSAPVADGNADAARFEPRAIDRVRSFELQLAQRRARSLDVFEVAQRERAGDQELLLDQLRGSAFLQSLRPSGMRDAARRLSCKPTAKVLRASSAAAGASHRLRTVRSESSSSPQALSWPSSKPRHGLTLAKPWNSQRQVRSSAVIRPNSTSVESAPCKACAGKNDPKTPAVHSPNWTAPPALTPSAGAGNAPKSTTASTPADQPAEADGDRSESATWPVASGARGGGFSASCGIAACEPFSGTARAMARAAASSRSPQSRDEDPGIATRRRCDLQREAEVFASLDDHAAHEQCLGARRLVAEQRRQPLVQRPCVWTSRRSVPLDGR